MPRALGQHIGCYHITTKQDTRATNIMGRYLEWGSWYAHFENEVVLPREYLEHSERSMYSVIVLVFVSTIIETIPVKLIY